MRKLQAILLAASLMLVAAPALAQEGGGGRTNPPPLVEQMLSKADIGEFIGLCAVIGGLIVGALAVLLFGSSTLIATLRGDAPNAESIAEQLDAVHDRLDRIESRLGAGQTAPVA